MLPDYGKHLTNMGMTSKQQVIILNPVLTMVAKDPNGSQVTFEFAEDKVYIGSLITKQKVKKLKKLFNKKCMISGNINPKDSWSTPEGVVIPIYGKLTETL